MENEKKFKTLEKERTNALEVAKKAYEERKAKATEKESLSYKLISRLYYSNSTKTGRWNNFHIVKMSKCFCNYKSIFHI